MKHDTIEDIAEAAPYSFAMAEKRAKDRVILASVMHDTIEDIAKAISVAVSATVFAGCLVLIVAFLAL